MKKLATTIAAIALIGTPAFAADMAVKMPVKAPPAPPAPVQSWTGFYVGVNGGYGFGKPSANLIPADPLTTISTCLGGPCPAATSFDINGGLGGLQAGYNWQFAPTWLAGLEADFQWSDIKGTGSSTFGFNGPPATYFAQQQIEDFGTVRARLGWLPTNNVLLYATGGFAYGRVKDTVSITAASNAFLAPLTYFCSLAAGVTEVPNCFLGNNSRWETGWTAGAGLEYSPWEHISFKVEYLFVGLGNGGNVNVVAQSTNGVPATPASFTSAFSRTDFNVVRGGINWKFY
jgi:outer membrane immunogenic protein